LEPTKGIGNQLAELDTYEVTAPEDFFLLDQKQRFDCVIMNPPFSTKSAILDNAPKRYLNDHGMKIGYKILQDCMRMSDHVIALMPWFTLVDSDVRMRELKRYGLISVTGLPRKTFDYARIQTCVLQLSKGYSGPTEFHVFDLLPTIPAKHELLLNL
jgi:type I restriction-modification system DNA methylase subunit